VLKENIVMAKTLGFESMTERLIEAIVALFVLFTVAVALMPTLHSTIAAYVANLTGIGLSAAAVIAGVLELIFWLLVTVAVVKGAIAFVKG
jgi:hypothetical protein